MSGNQSNQIDLRDLVNFEDHVTHLASQNKREKKTFIEKKFNSHLEGMLREGIDEDNQGEEGGGGRSGLTYGYSILAAVVYERYEMAMAELDALMKLGKNYPDFNVRAGRFVEHGKVVIRAIKAKRAIGKLPHISRSKKKELVSVLGQHYVELRACVLNIEKIERHVRKADISSTKWFVLLFYWSMFFVFAVALVRANFPEIFIVMHAIGADYLHQFFMWLAQVIWPIT